MYEGYKLYGPYKRKDGREHVILISKEKRKTISCPKYLVEQRIGRYLDKDETVDHIDGDFTNNESSNLRIVNRKRHCRDDAQKLIAQIFICAICDKDFLLEGARLSDAIQNRKQGKAGPFCGRFCAGKYAALGEILSAKPIKPSYSKKKDTQSLQCESIEVDSLNSGKP